MAYSLTRMNIPAAQNLHLREEDAGFRIPLEPNLNDKGCLFAGSIYAGAVLAAYRAAERLCAGRGLTGELVAKTASVQYLKRIASDGLAVATPCGEPLLKPNGNRKMEISVAVKDADGAVCAEVKAELILLAKRPS